MAGPEWPAIATLTEGSRPLGPEVQVEFQLLMSVLDLGVITREQWDRLKSIVVLATLEAGDAEAGARGHARALALWRESNAYDGED
jgi:hypothetical protein